jgi:catechol 2,3-dioxygenase-like lactoylglutathione lyase family enzyme
MPTENDSPCLAIVILAVDDLQRAVAFYQTAFGWRAAATAPVYVELLAGPGARVGLYERASFALNTRRTPAAAPREGTTASELYVRVDDVAAACERLAAAGAIELDGPAERTWGDVAAYFLDPDGNVVAVAREIE